MHNEFEYLKSLNLVEVLSSHYQLQFQPQGSSEGYVCLSPFTNETQPSFYVKQAADGHWLFKDFSSGAGGSIIDFVLLKEQLRDVSQAVAHLRKLFNQSPPPPETPDGLVSEAGKAGSKYDIHFLYKQMKKNDTAVCRKYLGARGISEEFIRQLEEQGLLLHNVHQKASYCSFAVYDAHRQLRCIDNHQINGAGKFVLGRKYMFSLDWPVLAGSAEVFICESIIDYLSLKTMAPAGSPLSGLALLGNQPGSYDLSFLKDTPTLVSCFDNDVGGFRGYLDLTERFPEKQLAIFELGPGQKDVNERLLAEKQAARVAQLTAEDKLALYKAFIQSENREGLAQDWGIDRSYLYKIVKDCEAALLSEFNERRPGRKSSKEMESKAAAQQRVIELEAENQRLRKESTMNYARSEFLKLRLKWSEREVSELRGEPPDTPLAKKQIKKKKKKKP
jgi:DNA primase